MSKELEEEKKIHLSNLDEFLASTILEAEEAPIKLAVHKNGDQGYISTVLLSAKEDIEEGGIDFDLSSCECAGLDSMEISYFLKKPVFTSSAYEFFDFLFVFLDSFECLVGFTGNGWKIKILKTEEI
ncbi:MAG: hypothetical protein HYW01_01240 [Deltaproteobacteria bacterium]|nr:hypothetical protein [Deltaproteobacteria bacterium]